jgi:hypothetical protein
MEYSKKRKYSTAFDTVVSKSIERCSIRLTPYENRYNIIFDTESNLLYIDFLLPKKFDVISKLNIDIADKVEIIFNYHKFDFDPSIIILNFASYMTCIKLRIYFDISKQQSSFNISFDGHMLDSLVKDMSKEYYSTGFHYKRGIVSASAKTENDSSIEFKL